MANMILSSGQLKGTGTEGRDAQEHPLRPLLECYCEGIMQNCNVKVVRHFIVVNEDDKDIK